MQITEEAFLFSSSCVWFCSLGGGPMNLIRASAWPTQRKKFFLIWIYMVSQYTDGMLSTKEGFLQSNCWAFPTYKTIENAIIHELA